MIDERWLSVERICEVLDVHPDTVRGWLRTGKLRGTAFGGRTGWRVRESDFAEFLEATEAASVKLAA